MVRSIFCIKLNTKRRVCSPRTMENRSLSDVGGTPGGIGHFLIGFVMACVGGYFLANQVNVVGSYWSFYGANIIVMLILLVGGLALIARSLRPHPATKSE